MAVPPKPSPASRAGQSRLGEAIDSNREVPALRHARRMGICLAGMGAPGCRTEPPQFVADKAAAAMRAWLDDIAVAGRHYGPARPSPAITARAGAG